MSRGREKVIVVTGASGGVGRGIARACGGAGWTVWIAARRRTEGLEVAREVDAAGGVGRFVSCDVGDAASVGAAVDAILEEEGQMDGVVHNATSGLSSVPVRLAEISPADLRAHFAVSVRGTWLLAQASSEPLRAARGTLLVLTSEAAFEGKERLAPYAAVKAMQRGMARALAREWGPEVRVNCLAPLASSPAMERALASDPGMATRVLGRNPLRRLGDPLMEIGAAARFLLSDDASYITGHTLMVDGGSCPAI